LTISLPDDINVVEIQPKNIKIADDPVSLLQEALEKPIGNVRPLEEIVKDKNAIAVVVDDATRTFPRDQIVVPFFDLLQEMGVDKDKVTIIIGVGTHANFGAVDDAKIEEILGKKIPASYKVEVHDSAADNLVDYGKTSRGTPIRINKTYSEADCKILITDVSFHYYAGFGGDRKSIVPAIAGDDTINANHAMLMDANATTGNLASNPVNLDMVEGAKKVGADFVINVVAHGTDVIDVKAGELGVAFEEAVNVVKNSFQIGIEKQADLLIVSAGGTPKDINLYQATKAITQTIGAVKSGGQIIFLAECTEGIGHPAFEEWIEDAATQVAGETDHKAKVDKAYDYLATKIKTGFVMGGHKAYFVIREQRQANIAMLSSLDASTVEEKYLFEPIKHADKTMQKDLQAFVDGKIEELKPSTIYVIQAGGELFVTHTSAMGEEKAMISAAKKRVKIGPPFITKYEKSRIVGARALQLSLGAPPLILPELITPDVAEPLLIADIEMKEKVLPIIIRRVLPSKEYADYPLDIFPGDASAITRDVQ
jgi:nickel-dependent lactate racemase/DNA-directed RNA polymerase subunit K/omega